MDVALLEHEGFSSTSFLKCKYIYSTSLSLLATRKNSNATTKYKSKCYERSACAKSSMALSGSDNGGIFKVLFGNQPIKGMEIGVWYGKGSTKIWLENCSANSEFWLVDTWRPFSSKEDMNEDDGHNHAVMDQLSNRCFS